MASGRPGNVSGTAGFSENFVTRFHSVAGQHAEVNRVGCRNFHHAHGDVSALLDVVGDHRAVIHLVDVISREHEHVLGPMRQNQLNVLVDRVGGATVPERPDLLLCRNGLDKFTEFAAQVAPAALHVLDERLRLVLREDGDLANPGIHAVRKHEIDDAELPAERVAGLQRCAVRSFNRSPRPPAMMIARVPPVRRLT